MSAAPGALDDLTSTVLAITDGPADPVPATEVVRQVLARHPEYAGRRPRPVLPLNARGPQRPPREWAAAVLDRFGRRRRPALHGRLLVVGLAVLDPDAHAALARDGYLDRLVEELKERDDRNRATRELIARSSTWRDAGHSAPDLPESFEAVGEVEEAELDPSEALGTAEEPAAPPPEPFITPTTRDTLWRRLSPSTQHALAYADAVRTMAGGDTVHVEHLVLGLCAKPDGPTRAYVDGQLGPRNEVLSTVLAAAVHRPVPEAATVPTLDGLPALSGHVDRALRHAVDLADRMHWAMVRSRCVFWGLLQVTTCSVTEALARSTITADGFEAYILPAGLGRTVLLAGTDDDTVPEPGNGTVRAADRLGTAADVEMLVPVLMATDTPMPVAVGLFGNWGSGKSFFMAQMQERAAELAAEATAGTGSPYCATVQQIRFNAWHYADGDLWASLAATLFDELARPLQPDATVTKLDELARARDEAEESDAARRRIEQETTALRADLDRPGSVVAGAVSAIRADDALAGHLRRLGADPGRPDDDLTALLARTGDAVTGLRRFGVLLGHEIRHARPRSTLLTLVVLAAVAAFLVFGRGLPVVADVLAWVVAAVVPVLPAATAVVGLLGRARAARTKPLQAKQGELEEARRRKETADQNLARRSEELTVLRSRRGRLETFVRDRSGTSDYTGRLGTISVLRRDIEQLVTLLRPPPVPDGLSSEQTRLLADVEGVHRRQAAAMAGIAERTDGLDRIILYIDDLDRCPADKVVDVLQAVHLLLAFPLFVVVVGVDSRWLENALDDAYPALHDTADYLEKIFQIPFRLNDMELAQFRTLVTGLVPAVTTTPPADHAAAADPAPAGSSRQESGPEESGQPRPAAAPRTEPVHVEPARPTALVLTPAERELLGDAGLVVTTPRSAKRLVNLYRILRVSLPEDEFGDFTSPGDWGPPTVVLLLSVLVGRARHAEEVFAALLAEPDGALVWPVVRRVLGDPDVGAPDVLAPLRERHPRMTVAKCRIWVPRVTRFAFRTRGPQRRATPSL